MEHNIIVFVSSENQILLRTQLEMFSADTKITNLELKNCKFLGKSNAKQDVFCPGIKKRSQKTTFDNKSAGHWNYLLLVIPNK